MGKVSIENSTASAAGAFHSFARNSSYVIPGIYDLELEDSNWVLTSSFIIFTMQTGNDIAYKNQHLLIKLLLHLL